MRRWTISIWEAGAPWSPGPAGASEPPRRAPLTPPAPGWRWSPEPRTNSRTVAVELRHDPVVLPADLEEPAAAASVARRALDALGHVDVLVNNAATAARLPTVDTRHSHHRQHLGRQRASALAPYSRVFCRP